MRLVLYATLAAAILFLGGCGPVRPMTLSEFNGFCYQTGENRFQSCDTISVCNPYDVVMNMEQQSLQNCLAECQAIHDSQSWTYVNTDCAGPNDDARDWCQRYCRTNFTK